MPRFISKLSICLMLTASGYVTTSLAVPTFAQAGEPSAINKRDYDSAFRVLKSDINDQIKRKNTIYESTIKRQRDKINTVLGYMKRSDGVDIRPYQKEVDDFIKDAYARLKVGQLKNAKDKIDKNVPTIAALKGIDTIKITVPTWCSDDAAFKKLYGKIYMPKARFDLTLMTVREAARFSCNLPDYEPVRKWTQAWRQYLSNTLGLTRKENEALIKYAVSSFNPKKYGDYVDFASKVRKPMCSKLRAPKKNVAIEVFAEHQLISSTLHCSFRMPRIGGHMRFQKSSHWIIDVPGAPTSELGKLSLAHTLQLENNSLLDLMNPESARNPFAIINDFGVANSFGYDRKKALLELEQLGFNSDDLWMAKMAVMGAAQDLEKAKNLVLKAAESNPAFKTIFIDAPKKGYANYANTAKGGKGALELVLALEDSLINADGDLEGCAEALYEEFRPWLRAHVKANKITNYRDVNFNSFTGSLLLHGLTTCATHEAHNLPAMRNVFKETYYVKTEIHRGPLSSAYQSMLAAYNDYLKNPPVTKKFSRTRGVRGKTIKLTQIFSNPIQRPQLVPPSKSYAMDNKSRSQGVIARISKADGGYVKIDFKSEKYRSAIRKCTSTGKINYIDSNGHFIPHYNCRTTGYEMLTRKNGSTHLPAWLAKGLKKGNLLAYTGTSEEKATKRKSYSFPYAAYKTKNAKKAIMFLGVYLK